MAPSRPSLRIARGALVWGLFSFGLIQGTLLWWLETRRPDLVAPDFYNRLRLVRERQREEPERPLCLVIGSSRIDMEVVPEWLPPLSSGKRTCPLVFNFSSYGIGPRMQWVYLRRLLENGIRPRWVVLEVMPMYLSQESERLLGMFTLLREGSQLPRPVRQWVTLKTMADRRVDVLPAVARSLFRPTLDSALPSDPVSVRPPRRLPLGGPTTLRLDVPPETRRTLAAAQRGSYLRCTARFAIHPGLDRALRESLALCYREGIRPVLFLSPEGSDFTAAYPPGAQALVGEYCRRLAAETGVRLVDGRNWLADSDFYDGHHPLRRGAEKLTRRLAEEVLKPLFKGSLPATARQTETEARH